MKHWGRQLFLARWREVRDSIKYSKSRYQNLANGVRPHLS